MMLPLALVFALTLPIIRAQVPHWGPCPEPAVQPAFSLKQVPVTVADCAEYAEHIRRECHEILLLSHSLKRKKLTPQTLSEISV